MKYVNVNFPDDFLVRLDAYCEKHRMKRNAVLMLAMERLEMLTSAPDVPVAAKPVLEKKDDWGAEDLAEEAPDPPRTPTYEEMIASGQFKPAPQPGERRVVYDDGRKR